MRIKQRIFATIIAIVFAVTPGWARIDQLSLKEVVSDSELIVTGKVIGVIECYQESFPWNLKLAELEVTRTIKGNPHLTKLFFLASPTWGCDISDATGGETVLLLLKQEKDPFSESSYFSTENPGLAKTLQQYLQNRPVFYIVHNGGGRMPIESDLLKLNSHVYFPPYIKVAARKPTKYSYEDFASYSQVITYIKRQLRLQKKPA